MPVYMKTNSEGEKLTVVVADDLVSIFDDPSDEIYFREKMFEQFNQFKHYSKDIVYRVTDFQMNEGHFNILLVNEANEDQIINFRFDIVAVAEIASNILDYVSPILMSLVAEAKKHTQGNLSSMRQSLDRLREGARQLHACIAERSDPVLALAQLLAVAYLNQKSLLSENLTLKNLQSALGSCMQDKTMAKILSGYRGTADAESSAACVQKLRDHLACNLNGKNYSRLVDNLFELHSRSVSSVAPVPLRDGPKVKGG